MRLIDFLDKGASLGAEAPCLTMDERTLSYRQVQALSYKVGRALARDAVRPGDKVAILSSNDPVSFACVFGISRAGAVWTPINPRNEAAENQEVLDAFDCCCLLYQKAYAPLVARIWPQLPKLRTLVCVDDDDGTVPSLDRWMAGVPDSEWAPEGALPSPSTIAMIVGTGGTTGKPKGVMLTEQNIETMSALTLMGYPFPRDGRAVYLALPPLTHAAGVLCFPLLCTGAKIVIMAHADLPEFLALIERHQVTHTFLPPTVIYMLLARPDLEEAKLGSLQCFWYGAAPMSAEKLERALTRIGPVMAQLFGQSEAPMFISMMAPRDHFRADGSIARERLASAGKISPLVTAAIMDESGTLLGPGERGEIVVRGSLVMAGYYKNEEATREVSRFGWHHTGDVGYLDDDGFLFIVDRAKDMIITGGFNVYSSEVEQALMQHPQVQDCAIVGLPDDKWGERVTAVLQLKAGATVDPDEVKAFVKARIGSVKSPKQVEIWADLPRSKVGKVLKKEIRAKLLPPS
jgi:acyl-CoA synthetase (AMP-forming)/AMP-acid ligase II